MCQEEEMVIYTTQKTLYSQGKTSANLVKNIPPIKYRIYGIY